MYSSGIKRWARRLMEDFVAPILGRLGITPNMVTLIGVLLTAGVAAVLANGNLQVGGVLLILASIFDLFDGALARATNQSSRFGAFFDSIMDRYSEAVVFFGLLMFIHTKMTGNTTLALTLVYASIIGSIMVSYARARAEGLDIPCETGWLGRPERITILSTCLIFGWLMAALWILAIFTNFTAIQRIYHVWRTEQAANPQPKPVKTSRWNISRKQP
ncbi:CDP-alcohol phosphatidyltransferase family protein [Herpetosiphon llansteffanensis]|uniref:CDP-alcohol phosphatidyltransferase family protein n=1 Tax=Herpetosiphon llansteffanensis TaxID=2094568 RepID=UPI00196A7ECD|nr:CDP-alcohol phosphatidyltransferase family protein [Herpetosiphon llansteffanensis]